MCARPSCDIAEAAIFVGESTVFKFCNSSSLAVRSLCVKYRVALMTRPSDSCTLRTLCAFFKYRSASVFIDFLSYCSEIESCGKSGYRGAGLDITSHDGPGADHCAFADNGAGKYDHTGADRTAVLKNGRLRGVVVVVYPWVFVVGTDHMRSKEDIFAEQRPVRQKHTGLQPTALTDYRTGADKAVGTDDAVVADLHERANRRERPDDRVGADLGGRTDNGALLDVGHSCHLFDIVAPSDKFRLIPEDRAALGCDVARIPAPAVALGKHGQVGNVPQRLFTVDHNLDA